MSALYPGMAVAVMLAAVSSGALMQTQETDPMVVSSVPAPDGEALRFQLFSSERPEGCNIFIGESVRERQTFSADQTCSQVHPDLLAASWWQERPDGSIAVLRPDGGLVAEFAVADGAAFESYSPPSPILVLMPDS